MPFGIVPGTVASSLLSPESDGGLIPLGKVPGGFTLPPFPAGGLPTRSPGGFPAPPGRP